MLEDQEVTTLLVPVEAGRSELIAGLRQLRDQFEQAADGQSLLDVQASVALIFWDLCAYFALTQRERIHVLGERLYGEVRSYVG